jgi:hypothetical protein
MSGEMLPQPPSMDGMPILEPKSIKVFGIIHIVFGALGLLLGLFSVATLIGIPFFLDWLKETVSQEDDVAAEALLPIFDALKTLFADLAIANWINCLLSLVVSILIIVAGIALVKKKKGCVEKSNRYVWCSVGAKIVNLVLFFSIGMAANRKYSEAIQDFTPDPSSAAGPGGMSTDQLQDMISTGGGVVGIIIALIYPIVAFVMLNKPAVKGFLSRPST